ncbi:MAG TPA: DUF4440 domain-containing protein [Acidimicrobiia bacterium]
MFESPNQVLRTLQQLEESLYEPSTRFDEAYMEELLAPDYMEFGSSGRVWTRGQIIRTQPVDIDARLPLPDFEVRLLGDEVALVTYRTEMGIDYATAANRCSVWKKWSDGRWRLVFHQATPTNRR